ncbi:MerR family transcriptional regulator [Candidatus Omnitrophota bacterium]
MKNIYLTKDLSRITGQSVYTIKYYLKIGLLKEFGRSPETNFRFFDDKTLEDLRRIRQMRRDGVSLKVIRQKLDKEKA